MSVKLCYTLRIRGFHQEKIKYSQKSIKIIDWEYFKLKICQLPEISSSKEI